MQILDSVASTMDVARENLQQGSVHFDAHGRATPVGVAAREQRAGRGQRGRSWYAPRDSSLCATFYFRRGRVTPVTAGELAFLAGLAVADVLHRHSLDASQRLATAQTDPTVGPSNSPTPRIGLKWPNDILLNGKKMGGILIELAEFDSEAYSELDSAPRSAPSNSSALSPFWVALIGVGLNIDVREFPPELMETATSLALEGLPATPWEPLGDRIGVELERYADVWQEGGFPAILSRWQGYDETPGRLYGTRVGGHEIIGTAEGVAPDGSLLLCLPEGGVVAVQSASALRESREIS